MTRYFVFNCPSCSEPQFMACDADPTLPESCTCRNPKCNHILSLITKVMVEDCYTGRSGGYVESFDSSPAAVDRFFDFAAARRDAILAGKREKKAKVKALRAKKLTKTRRSEIAKSAAKARWARKHK